MPYCYTEYFMNFFLCKINVSVDRIVRWLMKKKVRLIIHCVFMFLSFTFIATLFAPHPALTVFLVEKKWCDGDMTATGMGRV